MPKPAISYTNRDYDATIEAMKTHLATKFPDTFKDFTESNVGIAFIEIIAFSIDVLSFMLDYQANETFLDTARDRVNIIKFAKLVGYKVRGATSAAVQVKGTIASAQTKDVIVPEGAQITSASGVIFRTLSDQRIPTGDTSATIVFTEGEARSDSFSSNADSFQKFALTADNTIFNSISVTVDGEVWDEVDSLVFATDESKEYTVDFDENDAAFVRFGDGESGLIPPIGSAIEVEYRVGGGFVGNIATSEIDQTLEDTAFLDGIIPTSFIDVVLLNEERGSGGEDRETNGHIKLFLPRHVTTNGRAVTQADFNTLANTFSDPTFGSPAFASAFLAQKVPELNLVKIALFARDNEGNITTPSSGLKQAMEDFFNNNGEGAVRIINTDVEVEDGELVFIDIALTATVLSDFAVTDVTQAIAEAIGGLFDSSAIQPGESFRLSRVYDVVQDVNGVQHLLVNTLTASVKATEQIGLGDGVETNFITQLDLETGLPVVPLTFTLTVGPLTVTDDGVGNLVGDVGTGNNTIDYDTGDVDVTLSSVPPDGDIVSVVYRRIIDFQRGGPEKTGDGSTLRFKGSIEFPPIVPFSPVLGINGIAFSDGAQVILDDGDGGLEGDVDLTGVNVIDYDTGAYDMTFSLPPANGAIIRSTYRQRLETPSEDIPIDKNQLAVLGLIDTTTVRS